MLKDSLFCGGLRVFSVHCKRNAVDFKVRKLVIHTVYLPWMQHIQQMSGNNLIESIFVNFTGK